MHLAVRELFVAVEQLTGDRAAALLASAGFGVTVPTLFLSTAAYPELAVATLAIALFRRWVSPTATELDGCRWDGGWRSGLLPFFHIKFFPLAAVFVVGSLVLWPKKRRAIVSRDCGHPLRRSSPFVTCYLGSPNPLASYGTQRVFLGTIFLSGSRVCFSTRSSAFSSSSPFYIFAVATLGSYIRRQTCAGLAPLRDFGCGGTPWGCASLVVRR